MMRPLFANIATQTADFKKSLRAFGRSSTLAREIAGADASSGIQELARIAEAQMDLVAI
jgi:hypothetical protein